MTNAWTEVVHTVGVRRCPYAERWAPASPAERREEGIGEGKDSSELGQVPAGNEIRDDGCGLLPCTISTATCGARGAGNGALGDVASLVGRSVGGLKARSGPAGPAPVNVLGAKRTSVGAVTVTTQQRNAND